MIYLVSLLGVILFCLILVCGFLLARVSVVSAKVDKLGQVLAQAGPGLARRIVEADSHVAVNGLSEWIEIQEDI